MGQHRLLRRLQRIGHVRATLLDDTCDHRVDVCDLRGELAANWVWGPSQPTITTHPDQPTNSATAAMVDAYLALDPIPEYAVFHVRLGLSAAGRLVHPLTCAAAEWSKLTTLTADRST